MNVVAKVPGEPGMSKCRFEKMPDGRWHLSIVTTNPPNMPTGFSLAPLPDHVLAVWNETRTKPILCVVGKEPEVEIHIPGEAQPILCAVQHNEAGWAFLPKKTREDRMTTEKPAVDGGGRNYASLGGDLAEFIVDDGWYRPDPTNFFPPMPPENRFDPEVMRSHVLDGWLPPAPFITKSDMVTCFGSCFAWHVEVALRKAGYTTAISRYGSGEGSNYWSKSLVIKCGEAFVNTFSLVNQLRWAFEGTEPDFSVWHKSDNRVRRYVDSAREPTKRLLSETDVFIFSLGLSEVWYEKASGKVLWTGVPKSEYDPAKYGFRVSTVQENTDNIKECVRLLRAHRGNVPIIFTLSPVTLVATFRPVSCISANSVSKAVLRAAVDEALRSIEGDSHLFYFPSYDLVTGYFSPPAGPDWVHPAPEVVDAIMGAFMRYYCLG